MSVTLLIIILSVIVSYMCFNNPALFHQLKHNPYIEHRNKEYFRMLTAGFVHGNWTHLLINMFVLYQFGEYVEGQFDRLFGSLMGRVNYLLLYLLTIIFADAMTFVKHKNNPHFSSVGASGGVSGVLFVYVLFQPWSWLLLFFVIPIPAIVAAVLYLIYSSWASKNSPGIIDHDAHFYGAVFGFAFALLLKPALFSGFLERLVNQAPF
ncbi:MAG: rhomboid family intramembrane serine protease [Bacteroidetes bacterium]|nr:MAG: rhomboid family intramembrane serine protease [Bacteroidota bacterium]